MTYIYLCKFTDIPIGSEYRMIAENCDYWQGRCLIETKQPLDLELAPDTYPNGVSTSTDGCVATWEVKQAEVLPDLIETAQNVAINAFNRPVETMQALLEVAPIDNVVGLYNADGTIRIAKVGD